MAKTYYNGIAIATGFVIEHITPVDDRMVVPAFADLATLNYLYDGLRTYVQATKQFYYYDAADAQWRLDGVPLVTELIAVGDKILTGNDLELQNVEWVIDGVLFFDATEDFVIPNATTGMNRTDVIVADNLGGQTLLLGTESATNPIPPAIPNNTVAVTYINVFGDEIQIPPDVEIPTFQQVGTAGRTLYLDGGGPISMIHADDGYFAALTLGTEGYAQVGGKVMQLFATQLIDFAHEDGVTVPKVNNTNYIGVSVNNIHATSQGNILLSVEDLLNIPFVTPEDFGAIGNGVSDDSVAFQLAINSGKNIFLGFKTYYIASQLNLNASTNIFGGGYLSRVYTDQDITIFNIQSSRNTIYNFTIEGNGRGTLTNYATTRPNQIGIKCDGFYFNNIIQDVRYLNLGQAGFYGHENSDGVSLLVKNGVIHNNCHFEGCLYGAFADELFEYNLFNNCNAEGNEYGIELKGGNNSINGGSVITNRTGLRLTTGFNDGHSVVNGVTINHNIDYGIDGANIVNGHLFSNCIIFFNAIRIVSCTDIIFDGGLYKNNSGYPFTITNCPRTIIQNIKHEVTPSYVITGDTPRFFNNSYPSTIPAAAAESIEALTNTNIFTINGLTSASALLRMRIAGTSRFSIGSDTAITAGLPNDLNIYVHGNNNLALSTNNVKRLTISGAGLATFSGNVSSNPAPTVGDHLTNKTYVDGLVAATFRPAGNWDASGGLFPTVGTGTAGAVRAGDVYKVSVAGTMGGETYDVGDTFYAIVDTPGQTASNWGKFEVNTAQATDSYRGTMFLYNTLGTNTNGTITQDLFTTTINNLDLQEVLNNGSEGSVTTDILVESGNTIGSNFSGVSLSMYGLTRNGGISSTYSDDDTYSSGGVSFYSNIDDSSTGTGANFQGINAELEDVSHSANAGGYVHRENGAVASLTASTDIDGGATHRESTIHVNSYSGIAIASDTDISMTRTDDVTIKSLTFDPERIRLFVEDVINGYGGNISIDEDGLTFRATVATGITTVGFNSPVAETSLYFPASSVEDDYTLVIDVEGNVADSEGKILLPTFFRQGVDTVETPNAISVMTDAQYALITPDPDTIYLTQPLIPDEIDNIVTNSGSFGITYTATRIFVTFNGTTGTCTLPALTGGEGAMITFINQGSGTLTINSNAGGNDIEDNGALVNTKALTTTKKLCMFNNGNNLSILWQ